MKNLTWQNPEQLFVAQELINKVKSKCCGIKVRLKWDYQEVDPQAYWEIRIEQSELTGHINLVITDYADDEDIDDLSNLWDDNMERLHRVSGL